ncbi:GntP family permease [Bacteroidota bacterium]
MLDPLILLGIGIAIVVGGIVFLKLHPFFSLIMGALIVGLLTSSENLQMFAMARGLSSGEMSEILNQSIGERVARAFGSTVGKVGILIAMASIIADCLFKSGGADKIIRKLIKAFGINNAPLAFLSGSFTLAMPVFFDTVFYLTFPLARTLAIRTRKNYGLYLMSIIAGGVMAHSLVPPTPGPLFVAAEMGVSIGIMIIGGIVIGSITSTAGYLYGRWADKKWPVPIRDSETSPIEELEARTKLDDKDLPSFVWAISPILVPIILIAGNTIMKMLLVEETGLNRMVLDVFRFAGDSNIALTLSAVIALIMLTRSKIAKVNLKNTIQNSLSQAGVIILITGAGGAFGRILEQTGISLRIGEMFDAGSIAILPVAFIITALIRTAQGSATVAMITAVGILGGIVAATELPFHPVYIALAIGCGSKLFPWMNDSGFWIVGKISGMTEKETIRNFSFLLSVMGIVGIIAIIGFALVFPLA